MKSNEEWSSQLWSQFFFVQSTFLASFCDFANVINEHDFIIPYLALPYRFLLIYDTDSLRTQTYFRLSFLSARKVTSASSSGKTISVTQNLLFGSGPIRLNDRCTLELLSREHTLLRVWNVHARFSVTACEIDNHEWNSEEDFPRRRLVFGKSRVDLHSLVFRATKVDLSVYVDSEKLAICRTQCL